MDQGNTIQLLTDAGMIKSLTSIAQNRQLMMTVKKTAMAVLNDRLAARVRGQQRDRPQQEEDNDEQVEAVATAVDAAIEFAPALDLNRRPRLSRTQAGELLS
jgi:hypothetical protein